MAGEKGSNDDGISFGCHPGHAPDVDEGGEAEKLTKRRRKRTGRPRSGQKRLTEETELKRLDQSRVGLIKGYNGRRDSLPRPDAKSMPGVVISCPIDR